MNMHFEGSTSVTLLFDFWKVHGPAGMVLSVFVVLLLTVFYELLKVWKITLEKQKQSHITHPSNPVSFTPDHSCFAPVMSCQDGNSALASSRSEISLAPTENTVDTAGSTSTSNRTQRRYFEESWKPNSAGTHSLLLHFYPVGAGYQHSSKYLLLCSAWLFHSLQTAVHMLQVTLGYMLMLCVMSYNVWIFLGVILGSVLGYFLAFPLLKRV